MKQTTTQSTSSAPPRHDSTHPRNKPLPELIGLPRWFQSLWPAAQQYGGWLSDSAATAQALLAAPQDPVVLHAIFITATSSISARVAGWRSTEGLYGERGFDYANIFCNPDEASALAPGRFERASNAWRKSPGSTETVCCNGSSRGRVCPRVDSRNGRDAEHRYRHRQNGGRSAGAEVTAGN